MSKSDNLYYIIISSENIKREIKLDNILNGSNLPYYKYVSGTKNSPTFTTDITKCLYWKDKKSMRNKFYQLRDNDKNIINGVIVDMLFWNVR